jgi:hypothetical protein
MAGSLPYSRRRISEGQIRVGDAERESALSALREHYAHGRLDAAELEERISAALVARTRGDLARLFFDLPGEGRPWPPPARRRTKRPGNPWLIAGKVVAAAVVAALLVGILLSVVLVTLFVTFMTFGGFLWLLVFWWLMARAFGWSCSSRRVRQSYRHHPRYWQPPGGITRV